MSSMQKSHEERAQSAAQKAADELEASRQDREEAPAGPRGGGVVDAAMGKAGEMKDAAADRARGAMDAAADKARGVGDAAADRTTNNKAGDEGDAESAEDVMLRVKEADQMTGQGFNDVGPMGEEGTGVPRRRRSS